ncbi:TonB-dependent receptor [Sphingomonas abietis]|uniref:TonB-dependent receptor n=1 Tax=Sphingomonas abietis TaxID=3012344 RepID=A0ABY7NJL1_9SPHN|nr:TonB-dependent receptor [Sphingomonas abietis]WBO21732.1 TonB-dependent receptor [Sphingomonas abietis]
MAARLTTGWPPLNARYPYSLAQGACGSLIAASVFSISSASAQTRTTVHLDLRPGPLSQAINEIAAQSGASIGTDDPALLRTPISALRIDGAVDQALRLALARTDLRLVRTGPASWRILREARHVPPSPPRRRPVPVEPAQDIVVTGSKLDTPLQDYPGSVTIIDGTALDHPGRERGTLAVAEIQANLLSTRLGPGRNKLFLRGIADSSFNGTSPALVGQYLGDLRLTYASPDPDLRLYDVDRVEILEGPQGTLYGAGSLGGILRAVPRSPDPGATHGDVWAGGSISAHGQPGADGGMVLNLPLAPRVALRVVGYGEQDGGYIDDIGRGLKDVNRSRVAGGRAALRVGFGSGWTATLGGIAQDVRNRDSQYADEDLGSLVRASAVAQPSFHSYRAVDLAIEGRVGGATLRSTTGYVAQRLGQAFDATQPDNDILLYEQRDRISMVSNETRLNGKAGDRLDWLAGIAVLHARSTERRALGAPDALASLGEVRLGMTEATAFGELALHPTSGIIVTGGGRVSYIAADGAASGTLAKPVVGTAGPKAARRYQWLATPMVGISWEAARKITVFARYAGGYRPGGLTVNGVAEAFDPDTIRTVELGFRARDLGRAKFHLSATAAASRWRDIQADSLDGLAIPHVANIGYGRVQSLSFDVGATPFPGIDLTASGFRSWSKLTTVGPSVEGPLMGPLPNVARYGAVMAVEYRHRIAAQSEIGLGVRGKIVGPSMLGIGPELSLPQGDYGTLAASASLTIRRATVTLDATNLLDARGNLFALGTPFTLATGHQSTPLRPRTLRLGVATSF